jgi:SAM-dependent methyltransferase
MGTAGVNDKLWGARARVWAELQEPIHEPIYAAVFADTKLGAGVKYLDAGCGSGFALALAAAAGASASGLDAAADLVAIARERAPGADIRQGELEELPFDDATFDLVTGFNSFQYAGAPVRALREARRVTRKGGHVVIVTWSPPELTAAAKIILALKPLMPPPPPGVTPPGPFALSDETALKALAVEAQLKPVAMRDVECPFAYPDVATGVRAITSSGVAARAIGHSGEDAVVKAHEAVLGQFKRADGSIFVPNRFRYLIAQVG